MGAISLLGSWDPAWIEDHARWLREHGPHIDAWKNRMSVDKLASLHSRVEETGRFYFFAYSPKSKNGSGMVEHRLECDNLEYSPDLLPFHHDYGHHHDEDGYLARLRFRVLSIVSLPEPLGLDFESITGTRIRHPMSVLNLPAIRYPD